jgi:D-arabinitol 4-dehydrogenase
LDRFGNPNIQDTNQRVAMDAYSKIPSFILPTIIDAVKAGRSIDSVAILPALFLAFLVRQQRGEIMFEYEDQAMDAASAKAIVSAEDPVLVFANDKVLFKELAGNAILISALRQAYDRVNLFI